MLAASFNSDNDELIIYRSPLYDGSSYEVMINTMLPWMLAAPLPTISERFQKQELVHLGVTANNVEICCITPGRVEKMEVYYSLEKR